MRVALTYNLKRSAAEEHAEFDTPATIQALCRLLAGLGHRAIPLEVSGSFARLFARLRRIAPDLVFNLAEGERGAFREAIYPALFDQLGLPYTGSGASTLALCLDKALAKSVASAAGVPTPRAVIVHADPDAPAAHRLALPVIVKPNFEGSSKGITPASVIADPDRLERAIGALLLRYPEGVIVEEFVDGIDVSVAWVAGLGLLPPIRYRYPVSGPGPFAVFDFAAKQAPERVRLEVPAALGGGPAGRLAAHAARAFEALGVTGYGRADFRITERGEIWFLEMNPLPALGDPDLFAAAEAAGAGPPRLIAAMLAAATPRRARS
jgi:D-alanine-D-alanine ligase